MRYLDFIGQAALALLFVTMKSFGINFFEGDSATTQFALGCWQYFSAVIFISSGATFHRQRLLYLKIATMHVVALILCQIVIPPVVLFVLVPWSLAIFYFIITCRWTFQKRSTGGNFLRHINF